MKPFLKWAGNKYSIINRILEVLPSGKRLIEPFVGSGAVFLNTDYSDYLLADVNSDLITLYRILSSEGIEFIKYCRSFFGDISNSGEMYYDNRNLFNTTTDLRLKSALFLYLNKHSFNGLCRYNLKGEFNAPFGRYKKPYFPEKEMISFFNKSLFATYKNQDFQQTMNEAESGDVLYCDPPYVPLSQTANFTKYSKGGFSMEDQISLVQTAEKLSQRGVTVVISNHSTEFVHRAYRKAVITKFDVQRYISCDGSSRGKAPEILAVFGG